MKIQQLIREVFFIISKIYTFPYGLGLCNLPKTFNFFTHRLEKGEKK